MRLILYHGTDYEIAQTIMRDEFLVKKNDEHWLGNGIYFYIDDSLAKWWTSNPTKKHGSTIKKPAIIKAMLIVPDNRVLDLRRKSDFDKLVEWELDYRTKCVEYASDEDINGYKYRCALFDDILNRRGIDVIIGGFDSKNQPYNDTRTISLLKKLRITYTEIQVCVKTDAQKELLNVIEINDASVKTMGDENGKAI